MKTKTSELTGAALDWAVAKCGGGGNFPASFKTAHQHGRSNYSTNWSQGGPIIEQEKIDLVEGLGSWRAELEYLPDDDTYYRYGEAHGPTPLIAAMRCFVASKLGDEVDVPDELLA